MEKLYYWLFFAFAVVCDVSAVVVMKLVQGHRSITNTVLIMVLYCGSALLSTMALEQLPMSSVYVIWAGLGTTSIVLIEATFFKEPVNTTKLLGIIVIVIGVLTIHFSDILDEGIA
eukprot:TRINITY_DN3815_c0_g1_i6.p1 TRINITY_DN3815_c0_g1~~TRINITY_DN3815_c0_g1_i6.p1  ORF type:complete len:116 (-),score=17.25 TRINITY_DN3815_c0_g1_i6:157-504(-)